MFRVRVGECDHSARLEMVWEHGEHERAASTGVGKYTSTQASGCRISLITPPNSFPRQPWTPSSWPRGLASEGEPERHLTCPQTPALEGGSRNLGPVGHACGTCGVSGPGADWTEPGEDQPDIDLWPLVYSADKQPSIRHATRLGSA